MSVLIKGLEMPKKGLLEVIISPDGIAYALDRPLIDTENASVSRFLDAVELPDHGDLIDRDALKEECKEPNVWWETEYQMGYVLAAAQVIIPAERE